MVSSHSLPYMGEVFLQKFQALHMATSRAACVRANHENDEGSIKNNGVLQYQFLYIFLLVGKSKLSFPYTCNYK